MRPFQLKRLLSKVEHYDSFISFSPLAPSGQFRPSSLPEACSVCLVQSIIIGTEPDDRLAGTNFEPVLCKGERPNSLWNVFSFFFFSLRFYPPCFDPLNVRRHQQNLASRARLVNFFFFFFYCFRKCSIAPSTGKKTTVSLVPFFKPYTLYRLTFGPWQTGSELFTFIAA